MGRAGRPLRRQRGRAAGCQSPGRARQPGAAPRRPISIPISAAMTERFDCGSDLPATARGAAQVLTEWNGSIEVLQSYLARCGVLAGERGAVQQVAAARWSSVRMVAGSGRSPGRRRRPAGHVGRAGRRPAGLGGGLPVRSGRRRGACWRWTMSTTMATPTSCGATLPAARAPVSPPSTCPPTSMATFAPGSTAAPPWHRPRSGWRT